MAATPVPFAAKDNAEGQLNASIGASTLSIVLQSGDGAAFPQPYTGSATSAGSSTTLNSTGISAAIGGSAAIGKQIWNKTDGSVAVITAVATDAVTTTRLLGGSDNTWDSSDTWCIDPFVATLAIVNAENEITQYEEILVTARSTDTLTVPTGGRGYNGTVANSFSADDYVYLFSTAPIVERGKDVVSVIAVQQNTDRTTLAAEQTNIDNLESGSYHYVVATGSSSAYVAATPALGAYAAGNIVRFKANHTNTGSATLNVNGLGAKTIKKNDGATDLSANDIINGQIVEVEYDGTNFQMLSPVGTPPTSTRYIINLDGISNDITEDDLHTHTTETAFASTINMPANTLVAEGDRVFIHIYGSYSRTGSPTLTLRPKIGGSTIATIGISPNATGFFDILITLSAEAVGASGILTGVVEYDVSAPAARGKVYIAQSIDSASDTRITSFNTTTSKTISMTAEWTASSSSNASCILHMNARAEVQTPA